MKIGFVGIGNMGRCMAGHLIDGGHEGSVCDLDKTAASEQFPRGASWAADPAAIAAGSEIVFTSLPMPEDVEAVALGPHGVIDAAAPGSILCGVSTTDPDTICRIELAARDVALATELDRGLGVPMESVERIGREYAHALERDWGKLSAQSIIQLQEEWAEVEIRV